MTTVAYRDGVMACDTQLSGEFLSILHKKVIVGRNCMVGFCGDAVAAWNGAMYLAGECQDRPLTTNDDDVCFLIYRDGKLSFADREYREMPLKGNKFYAIGSGSQAAMVAMYMGATARQAVRMAAKVDDGTGGRILTFTTGDAT